MDNLHPEIDSLKTRWNQVDKRMKETESQLVQLDKEKQEIEAQAKKLRGDDKPKVVVEVTDATLRPVEK